MTEYTGAEYDDALDTVAPRKIQQMGTVHLPAPILGQIAWWQVLGPTIKHPDLPPFCERHGLGDPPPAQKLADVFRRQTTARTKKEYELTSRISVKLDLHLNNSLARNHIELRDVVRTVTRSAKRTIQDMDKVGTLVHDKRAGTVELGVEPMVLKLPDRQVIEAFIVGIRHAVLDGVDEVDGQGGRRLVRQFLTSVDALLLEGGPYFIPREADAERLMTVLAELGGSTGFYTPLIDGERQRQVVTEAYRKLGAVPERMAETYRTLGVQTGGTK